MQTRKLNEGMIGLLALGKMAELGRQLVIVADPDYAEKQGQKQGGPAKSLQAWGNGYVALDAVISVMGVLAMIQGMRKNRKGAGQAALVQGITATIYGLYYLLFSLFALKKASGGAKLINIATSLAHGATGVAIIRFSQKALR